MSELKVDVVEMTVKDFMEKLNSQKTITPRDITILLDGVNQNSGLSFAYSGVWSEDGKVCFGSPKGAVMLWEEFINAKIKVGNIQV